MTPSQIGGVPASPAPCPPPPPHAEHDTRTAASNDGGGASTRGSLLQGPRRKTTIAERGLRWMTTSLLPAPARCQAPYHGSAFNAGVVSTISGT